MAVNIKFEQAHAVAVCRNVLERAVGERDGITGFWKVALRRVQGEHLIRLADMTHHRFLLEAEIDPERTHRMDPARMEEYIDHQLIKQQITLTGLSPDEQSKARNKIRDLLHRCDRVVIAFRNARPLGGEIEHVGKNPIWYTED